MNYVGTQNIYSVCVKDVDGDSAIGYYFSMHLSIRLVMLSTHQVVLLSVYVKVTMRSLLVTCHVMRMPIVVWMKMVNMAVIVGLVMMEMAHSVQVST